MIKALFIDIDDTLLDYQQSCSYSLKVALDAIGVPYTPTLEQSFHAITNQVFEEQARGLHTIAECMELYPERFVASIGHTLEDAETFKQAFRKGYGEAAFLIEGVAETLPLLAQKYKLYIASNSFYHIQKHRLETAGILLYFTDLYISEQIGYDKPDPRFFQACLERCGLQPQEVLMVGDSLSTDIEGAANAGLHTCWFNYRKKVVPKGCKAEYVINEFQALIK